MGLDRVENMGRSRILRHALRLVLILCGCALFRSRKETKSVHYRTSGLPRGLEIAEIVEEATEQFLADGNLHHKVNGTKPERAVEECSTKRPTNVLTLGGSVTWGAALQSRENAYPFLLAPNVTNMAIRATGSEYPSICIQSMLETIGAENVEFDLITLEFTLNGLECVQPLLQRLRRRYPKAVIMFIDIWSFVAAVKDIETGKRPEWLASTEIAPPEDLQEKTLKYDRTVDRIKSRTDRYMQSVDGVAYHLPTADPKVVIDGEWFSDDYHHLGPNGHRLVANGVLRTYCEEISKQRSKDATAQPIDPIYDGTWGKGDHCVTWFEGVVNESDTSDKVAVGGGEFVEFMPTKFAHEVKEGDTLSFQIKKRFSEPNGVAIVHMAKGMPSVYPKSMVSISGDQRSVLSKMELDPLHWRPQHHITMSQVIGTLHPHQDSTITFEPLETTEEPLRLTAVMVCPECANWSEGDSMCPLFRPSDRRKDRRKASKAEVTSVQV